MDKFNFVSYSNHDAQWPTTSWQEIKFEKIWCNIWPRLFIKNLINIKQLRGNKHFEFNYNKNSFNLKAKIEFNILGEFN